MTSAKIRQDFLDFFKSKKHTIVASASIVPEGDTTLLFTNAGMNQFKDVFLGAGKREYTRAADTQKCMRVSGKHNDLDDVGRDTYHHTLFEMLGNWSFGDYYKKEAIEWAWELLTSVWKLPKNKLYATVYKSDDEAAEFWSKVTDIDKSHILRFAEKDNFWEMGETGPCGPCSEIHIDRGEGTCDKQHIPGHVCAVNAGCARYIELWNLVFIQYNRETDRSLTPLPSKHVDTGMGFERVVSVIQGANSNYDTDVFTPIIKRIEALSNVKYTIDKGMPHRVIADHIRSLTFALADGVMPSNEGRGYVIRKILRRAARYGKALGFDAPFLNEIVSTVVDVMGEAFPEIKTRQEMVKKLIFSEEDAFFKTLNRGMDKLQEIVAKVKSSGSTQISGDDVFMLYDSMGFPIDFAEQSAKDEDLTIDLERFRALMNQQKERARASWKGFAFDFSVIKGKASKSLYCGDDSNQLETQIVMLVKDGKMVESVSEGDEVAVIADKTPFYGEKGGQVGDSGWIEKDGARVFVYDTKIYEDTYLHFGKVEKGGFKKGDLAMFKVDGERKAAIARNHTATHLIHKALKETLGGHAAQSGSLVTPDRLRFDFTHNQSLSREEIERIENQANEVVLKNIAVVKTQMNKDEAVKSGAVAIFEEKYGDVVRVIEVPGFSRELCGGTHVGRTGDIGLIKIVAESSISAGNRRIEAVTGLNSLTDYRSYFYLTKELGSELKVDDAGVKDRIAALLEQMKTKEKEIEGLKKEIAKSGLSELLAKAVEIGGVKTVIQKVEMDLESMKALADEFRSKVENGVVTLISTVGGTVSIVNAVSQSVITKAALKAGDLAREMAKIVGGGGGGRPDFAQAGGKDASKAEEALKKAKEMIEGALKK